MSRILTLDAQGQPHRWVSQEMAVIYYAKHLVAWELGGDEGSVVFRGGENRVTGRQSRIVTAPIIAIKGEAASAKRSNKPPSLTNRNLFQRDHHVCGYCGRVFPDFKLTREHIVPVSRGGKDTWTNVITACEHCNHKKDDRLLEECGMEILYVPYVPSRAEALILENRHVLFCQMEYLKSFLPQYSRVWKTLKQ